MGSMVMGDNGWSMPAAAAADANAVTLSTNGRVAVSGHNDATVRVWDVFTARCLRTLAGHRGPVGEVAISENGEIAVSSGPDDSKVRVWELSTGSCVQILDALGPIGLSADGRTVVTGSRI